MQEPGIGRRGSQEASPTLLYQPDPTNTSKDLELEIRQAHAREFDQHHAGAASIRPHDSNQPRSSITLPLRTLEHALPIRTSSAQADTVARSPLKQAQRWLLSGTITPGLAMDGFIDLARITTP